jgi:hypothetical protein
MVEAIQKRIDGPPFIDVGVFELNVDRWMGIGSTNCIRQGCSPTCGLSGVLN